jgi:hypothetical protein
MQQERMRVVQEEREAREESGALRNLQGLLGQHKDALQVQGTLIFPFQSFPVSFSLQGNPLLF